MSYKDYLKKKKDYSGVLRDSSEREVKVEQTKQAQANRPIGPRQNIRVPEKTMAQKMLDKTAEFLGRTTGFDKLREKGRQVNNVVKTANDLGVFRKIGDTVQGGFNKAFGNKQTAWGTKGEKRDKSEVIQPSFKYKGNIDLNSLPTVQNEDGSQSTVLSFSIQDERDGKETLIPQVVNGKIVSEDEAIKHYYETGKHLGKFDTIKEANKYAEKLHEEEEKRISKTNSKANPLLYKTTQRINEEQQEEKKEKLAKNVEARLPNGLVQQEQKDTWGQVLEKTMQNIQESNLEDTLGYSPKIAGAALLGGKQGLEQAGQYYYETMPSHIDQGRWGEGISQMERNREIAREELIKEKGIGVINTEEYQQAGDSLFQQWAREDQAKIDKIIEEAPNYVAKKLAEQAPSFGNSTLGGAAGVISPIASIGYFFGSSGQSYYEDALNRGMNDDDAYLYSGIMATWESASDSAITAQNVNFLKSKITGKEINGNAMKLIGNQFVENAVQEAVTEPFQELMVGVTGGREYMQTSDLIPRMLDSGFWGGIQGALSGGLTGITASTFNNVQEATSYLRNKIQQQIEKNGKEKFARDFIKGAQDTMSKSAKRMAEMSIDSSQLTEKQRTDIMRMINKPSSNLEQIKNAIQITQAWNEAVEGAYKSYRGSVPAQTWQQKINSRTRIAKIQSRQEQKINKVLNENNIPSESFLEKAIEDTQKSIEINQKKLKTSKSETNRGVISKNIEVQTELLNEYNSIRNQIAEIKGEKNQNNENVVENVETQENQPSTMENKPLLENNQQTIQEENKMAENAISQEIRGNVQNQQEETQVIPEHSQETINSINSLLDTMEKNQAEEGWSEKNAIKEIQKLLAQENNDTSNKLSKYKTEAKRLLDAHFGNNENSILENINMTQDEWNNLTDEQKNNVAIQYLLSEDEVNTLNNAKQVKTAADPEVQEILNDIRKNSISNTMSEDAMTEEQEKQETQAENDISLLTNNNMEDLGETYSLKDNVTKDVRTKSKKELSDHTTRILRRPIRQVTRQERTTSLLWAAVVDKNAVFEDMDFRTKDIDNKSAQSAAQRYLNSNQQAYYAIAKGHKVFENGQEVKMSDSLLDIIDEVGEENRELFNKFVYYRHNVDRMTLEPRAKERAKALQKDLDTLEQNNKKNPPETEGQKKEYQKQRRELKSKIDYLNNVKNKEVMEIDGKVLTAEEAQKEVAKLEKEHPEFITLADKVYKFLDANNLHLKNNNVISDERIALFKDLYPHYVPIDRIERINGQTINVPLDSKRTTTNNPIHRAEGGTGDFLDVFDAIQNRTQQVFNAAARNNLGNVIFEKLGAINEIEGTIDENQDIMDFIETIGETDIEQKGKAPEMTIFQNGKAITFRTNEDIQYALSSTNDFLKRFDRTKGAKLLQKAMQVRRNVLTEWNPLFVFTNGMKDAQDVLFNSQHSARTYAKFPEAYMQIMKQGYWYEEYIANGGLNASLFTQESQLNEHEANRIRGTRNKLQTAWDSLGDINRVVEMAPRLAEYIASREMGRDIDTAMLDAARVTTNFSAGGEIGKFVNRNFSSFFNANVQGAAQQVRNVRENIARGPKGWANLVVKGVLAQLPVMLLNSIRWKDDDDYEKLSDYVKNNYYCIAKYGDGQFIRIPKGRIVATLQKVGSTIYDYANQEKEFTMDNAVDSIAEDFAFAVENIGVSNPVDNTLGAPLIQVATNQAWYGSPIVPQRLQDKSISEITDESTSELFNLIGRGLDNPATRPIAERLNINPLTMQYLAEQYGGGWSNVLLSSSTQEAKKNTNSLLNAVESKFSTNANFNNQDITDYYANKEKLEKKNKKSYATEEDKLKKIYVDSFSQDFSELYAKRRELQNGDLPNVEKYNQVLEVQKQIADLAKEVNDTYEDVKISNYKGNTATIGDKMYYKNNKGQWSEVKDEDKPSGISLDKYGKYKNDISKLTDKKKAKEGKDTASLTEAEKVDYLLNANYTRDEKETIYESMIKKDDKKYDGLKVINPDSDINDYLKYKSNSFSKKSDAEGYLDNSSYSGMEQLYLKGASYKLSSNERSTLIRYINTLSQRERDAILDGLSANNGKRDDNGVWQWSK